jgi:uncharacterized membrane protein
MTDWRPGLHALAVQHGLDAQRTRALLALVDDTPPPRLTERLRPGVAVVAALLLGLGAVMWVAAHWADWGRVTQFALLQGLVASSLLGAWALPRPRPALGLLALLGQGALFAYFGQTYQTGADPWQLFALWAALALPLGAAVRHDAVWAPWTLVATLAVVLWVQAHSGHRWASDAASLTPQLLGALTLVALAVALAPWTQRWHGAGLWAWRAQGVWGVVVVTGWALMAVFSTHWVAPYLWMGLLLLAAGAALWRQGDLVMLSSAAMALNVWALAGFGRWLFQGDGGRDWLGKAFVFGLVAAGLLASTVSLLMRRQRAGGAA